MPGLRKLSADKVLLCRDEQRSRHSHLSAFAARRNATLQHSASIPASRGDGEAYAKLPFAR